MLSCPRFVVRREPYMSLCSEIIMNDLKNKISLQDSLDREEIDQLHKAVLGFSTKSFEIKKLCVTVEVSACTLAATIFCDYNDIDAFWIIKKFIFLHIPILFYLVDISTFIIKIN